jgi:hypothetical protein
MKEPQGTESPMITQLDLLIEITQEQAKAMHTTVLPGQRRRKESDALSPSSPTFDDLDLFLGRVSQIKAWLLHNPQLLQVVDTISASMCKGWNGVSRCRIFGSQSSIC